MIDRAGMAPYIPPSVHALTSGEFRGFITVFSIIRNFADITSSATAGDPVVYLCCSV